MFVSRIGFTPLKGAAHSEHDQLELAVGGPADDRVFCLIDPAARRVLRTVENPSLVSIRASWDHHELTTSFPDGTVAGVPVASGESCELDYWGRTARVEIVDGPWAAAYSEFLGFPVLLGRRTQIGSIVYGAPISLVTTSSMIKLAEQLGSAEVAAQSARFRATFLVDTGEEQPHVEDTWLGRELSIGGAQILIRSLVPRCAVININPDTALNDQPVLKTLAAYRPHSVEIPFGVDAFVTSPGTVRRGDQVSLID